MRVIAIVDDERAAQTIAVLSRVVRVVPESSGLVLFEIVGERIS